MDLYLPTEAQWYFYPTGRLMTSSGQQEFFVSDDSIGVFVKAGSILPILDVKESRMSLLDAINDPLKLEIYLDPVTNTASGYLYIDDGMTLNYLTAIKTLV